VGRIGVEPEVDAQVRVALEAGDAAVEASASRKAHGVAGIGPARRASAAACDWPFRDWRASA
jgi:hypothetical protein